MEGMPRRCQQPLSDYGGSGVLGFYYAQLESIIQYRSLRTEVFQSFKEIGNAILFCLIVEQCLSQEEVLDLLQAAPFQGVLPRPYVKGTALQHGSINMKFYLVLTSLWLVSVASYCVSHFSKIFSKLLNLY